MNIPFPDVPDSPGVPALRRSGDLPPATQALAGIFQGALWRALQVDVRWGIFDKYGKALGDPSIIGGFVGGVLDSVGIGTMLSTNSVAFAGESRISDFPLERGQFASYNKAQLPSQPLIRLCLSGFETDRKRFLEEIDAAKKSTDLYSIVTPEVTYIDYSVENYSYERRSISGLSMLTVDLTLKEIRQVSSIFIKTEKPREPAAASPIDNGKIQPQPPKQSTLKKLGNIFGVSF